VIGRNKEVHIAVNVLTGCAIEDVNCPLLICKGTHPATPAGTFGWIRNSNFRREGDSIILRAGDPHTPAGFFIAPLEIPMPNDVDVS